MWGGDGNWGWLVGSCGHLVLCEEGLEWESAEHSSNRISCVCELRALESIFASDCHGLICFVNWSLNLFWPNGWGN